MIIQTTNNAQQLYQNNSHAVCVLLDGVTGAALTGDVITGMAAPTLSSVSGKSDTGFTLEFTAPTAATGQTLASYTFTVTDSSSTSVSVTTPTDSETSVDVTGLTAGTVYTYSLAAVDSGNGNMTMFLYDNPNYK